MGRYGSVTISGPASRVTAVVQSSSPSDLEARVAAALAAIPAGYLVVDITLAGAGDGHTFTVTIEAGLEADVTGGLAATPAVRCYLAANAIALLAARSAVNEAGLVLADSQVAGASQGTRFMGLLVYGDVEGGGVGPQGPQGADGAVGPQGPQGAQGATGTSSLRTLGSGTVNIAVFGSAIVGPFTRVAAETVSAYWYPEDLAPGSTSAPGPDGSTSLSWALINNGEATPALEVSLSLWNNDQTMDIDYAVVGYTP